MPEKTQAEPFSFYKTHPTTCEPDDFWGQVKRTVNGKPVPEEQIQLIVAAICGALDLAGDDILLDLCCGNGALTSRIFEKCEGGLGVDFSPKLIEIAHEFFEAPPERQFVLDDVLDYVLAETHPERYSKLLCYGSFAYLEEERAEALLKACFETYTKASAMFIGNCPDRSKLDTFFNDRTYTPNIETEPDSPIGIWRTRDEFRAMAQRAGWAVEFRTMPEAYYASKYRYDVILWRSNRMDYAV